MDVIKSALKNNYETRMEKIKEIDKLMLRGASLCLIVALILAWCLIGVYTLNSFRSFFEGNPDRVLSAHLDFLIMSSLIFGLAATHVPLKSIIKWFMVVGAFTNSSTFLVFAIFPISDPASDLYATDLLANDIFEYGRYMSFIITTIGFGGGAVAVFKSTF